MRNEVVVQMYMFIGSNSVVILRSTSNRQTVGRRPFITTGMPFAHAAVTTQEDGPFVPACQVVQEFLCNRRPPLQSTPILHSGGGYVWLYKAHHCCVETRCTVSITLASIQAVKIDCRGAGPRISPLFPRCSRSTCVA